MRGPPGSPFWIGYNDAAVEGTFVWSSGETPGYENWRAGEPDDLNGADWAALIPSAGTWVDETFLPERRGVVEVISDDCDGNGLPDAYEAAVDPSLDWNGDGVLDACVTANYCVAENNSTGVPAVIGASGSPIASENDFTLEAWDLPLNEFAYFLASESTAFIPGFGGSSAARSLAVGACRSSFGSSVSPGVGVPRRVADGEARPAGCTGWADWLRLAEPRWLRLAELDRLRLAGLSVGETSARGGSVWPSYGWL